MGYTEYFPQNRSFTDAEWDQIVGKVKAVFDWAKKYNVRIDDQEDGDPIANDQKIWFNGIGEECHETFVLRKLTTEGDGYNFCKTNEKPYNIVVQLTLMVCHEVAPDVLQIGSDGKWHEEWAQARYAYKEIFGKESEEIKVSYN